MEKHLVSISDVARQLGVSVYTIRRLIASGEVNAVNVGARRLVPATEINRITQKGAGKARPRTAKTQGKRVTV